MKIVIYGKDSCSYCKRAVELAKQLKSQGHGDYEYIDIVEAGIDALSLWASWSGSRCERFRRSSSRASLSAATRNWLL
jgi:glutaredoxin